MRELHLRRKADRRQVRLGVGKVRVGIVSLTLEERSSKNNGSIPSDLEHYGDCLVTSFSSSSFILLSICSHSHSNCCCSSTTPTLIPHTNLPPIMSRFLALLSLVSLSLVSIADAGNSCVAFDVNWNLLAFGFNGKDYNAGTQDSWASGE